MGIREKLTVAICIGVELIFLEVWLRLAGSSLWDYIAPLVPTVYFG